MCQMWQSIRYGVRWNPSERLALATRALDLKKVKSIEIAIDPLREGNHSLRIFWAAVLSQRVKQTNPAARVKSQVFNDRRPPSFTAVLDDGRKLRFETDNFPAADLVATFNRHLGGPELGKAGTIPHTFA